MTSRKLSLITGIAGFVGRYLTQELEENGNWEIIGIRRSGDKSDHENSVERYPMIELDIRDTESVWKMIQKIQPDVVFHLAAQAFVPEAIRDPWETMDTNVKGTLNLLESLRNLNKKVRMVYVSSADVYGKQDYTNIPLYEDTIANPLNPYSSSKLAAESYCRQYSNYANNLDITIARPFNHIGIGQRLEFVVPNFCSQVIQQKKSGGERILVGDLSSIRDFLDVRDVVKAYRYMLEYGESGQIYNICSGVGRSIQEILQNIIHQSGTKMEIVIDETRLRPAEASKLVGVNSKLKSLGWEPRHNIEDSLKDIYSWISNL